MAHSHHHGGADVTTSRRLRLVLGALVGAVVVATLAGLAALWPSGDPGEISALLGAPADLVSGTVSSTDDEPCPNTAPEDAIYCAMVRVRLHDGPDAGNVTTLEIPEGPSAPVLREGDRIRLGRSEEAGEVVYYFDDYQRSTPLLVLAGLFAVAVVTLGRWRGGRALIGLAVSLAVLLWFVIPAILDGRSPTAVALVGAAALMLVTIYLVHGFETRTTVAVLGTVASLALTAVLALVFVEATQLTGLASEEAELLRVSAEEINLRGLLLAGMIIGALGVLDDVTVTQVSAVWELQAANPDASAREVYRSALRIGRDHIASTVNTLVLAYAGAALPLLIFFQQAGRGLVEVLTGELLAIEVVRTLVGSIGLVASVPITTALAALVVRQEPSRAAPSPRLAGPPIPDNWDMPKREREWREAGP